MRKAYYQYPNKRFFFSFFYFSLIALINTFNVNILNVNTNCTEGKYAKLEAVCSPLSSFGIYSFSYLVWQFADYFEFSDRTVWIGRTQRQP